MFHFNLNMPFKGISMAAVAAPASASLARIDKILSVPSLVRVRPGESVLRAGTASGAALSIGIPSDVVTSRNACII